MKSSFTDRIGSKASRSKSHASKPTVGNLFMYEHYPEQMADNDRASVEQYVKSSPTMKRCRADRLAWEDQVSKDRKAFLASRKK